MTGTGLEGTAGPLLLAGLSALGISLLILAWWRLARAGARGAEAELLSDGAVLVVSDRTVQHASPEAVALLGDCVGRPIAAVLEAFLGSGAASELEAVSRLELTGDPIDRLVRTPGGAAYELIGAPSGALIRLVLRDARYLDERLREADRRIHAAEAALCEQSWETEALHALVAEGPLIAWHRTATGEVRWSAGQIRTRTGAVTPEQAVELIVARMRLNRQPAVAGEPQKSRIEIVVGEGAETVSLHVVEIVRQDGSRIGFGTDAGSAAAAERTLARFVQTMTETFAHLTVGLAIFDRNQTLALFNPALVQMWQVEPAWLARRPSLRDILDELRAIRRLPELEDFHSWRARLLGLFENTEAADYEELWHLADGSNIRVLARPHPHGALAFTFDDVTERMRLEQRYRHSIDLRRATLDGLAEGIAVFGANGLLQFVNQAFHEIWGTDGDTIYAAMHARQLIGLCEEIAAEPDVWQKLHGFITGEESRRAWTAQLRTGTGRVLTARFAPLPDGSTLAIFADITQSERIAEALIEGDAALELAETARLTLDGLVSAVASPALAGIEAELAAIRDAGPLPERAWRAGEAIAGGAAGLRVALTDAAAITARPFGPDSGQAAGGGVAGMLEFVIAIASRRAAAARVALSADTGGAPERVLCPAGQLGRVALQLAEDAIVLSPPGGDVVLRADGAADRFALHADLSAARPSQALDHDDRLARLVARLGGRIEIGQHAPGGPLRMSCRFERRQPGQDACAPADSLRAHGGTVHALRPRAS